MTSPPYEPDRPGGTAGTDELRRDGGPVCIRTITAADLPAVRALHLAASERSNYFRFFGAGRRGAIDYLPTLIAPASATHHALLAGVGDEVVAVGSFEGTAGGVAEVSLLVADDWQRDGIGTLLMEHLASAARLVGVHSFVAETLMENGLIAEVLRDLGYALTSESEAGTSTTTFDLAVSPEAVEARARRAQTARSAYAMQRGCVEDWCT